MPTLSPTFARQAVALTVSGGAATTYLEAAKAGPTMQIELSDNWETVGATVPLPVPGMGQSYTEPATANYINGVYILAYDLSNYDLSEVTKLTLKFDTTAFTTMSDSTDLITMQTRVFRTGYFLYNQQNAAWPNPDAGDAYYLLDEYEIPGTDLNNVRVDLVRSIDITVEPEYFSSSKQLWLVLIEKDHYDLIDPDTLTAGVFFYKSVEIAEPPKLEISLPTYLSATINVSGNVEATLSNEVAEPAIIFTEPMERSVYFNASTVGYSAYQPLDGRGAANYLTPVVPSKRLVPQSVLKPSQKEAI